MSLAKEAMSKRERIRKSGLTIYDPIDGTRVEDYFYSDDELLYLFAKEFKGASFPNMANRTRSKMAKSFACDVLGYPTPLRFQKTSPRFYNQNFDLLIHKAHNVQPVNQDTLVNRRFVLAKIDDAGTIIAIKLIHGRDLLAYDTTGTLTLKHQARVGARTLDAELMSPLDTWATKASRSVKVSLAKYSPVADPTRKTLLPIAEVFERLRSLRHTELSELGRDQERNRGAVLHEMVLKALGYEIYADNGRHPDVPHQLLEIKLQTSPTIDLGSVDPTSEAVLPRVQLDGMPIRHCDVRFAVFVGKLDAGTIRIKHLVVVTGRDFFTTFTKFGGKGINSKRQIHLPKDFFDN